MRRSKGFTLLEIVIALAILVIGLVGILSLFPVGFQASRRASMLTEATIHAQQEIENFKLLGYSALTDGVTGWTDFGDGVEWRVAIAEVNPPGGLKNVEVEVRWQEKGSYKSETFITYIAEK